VRKTIVLQWESGAYHFCPLLAGPGTPSISAMEEQATAEEGTIKPLEAVRSDFAALKGQNER